MALDTTSQPDMASLVPVHTHGPYAFDHAALAAKSNAVPRAAEPPGSKYNVTESGKVVAKSNKGASRSVKIMEVVPDGATAWEIPAEKYLDQPVDKMLRGVAKAHAANTTGYLDWYGGSLKANKPLEPIGDIVCDTLICAVLVPDYNMDLEPDTPVVRTSVANFIHARVRQIWFEKTGIQIPPRDVQLKSIHELGVRQLKFASERERVAAGELKTESTGLKRDNARVKSERALLKRIRANDRGIAVPCRERALENVGVRVWMQTFKIALPNMRLASVLDIVGSGTLAAVGVYHREIDITVDCLGTVRKHDLISAMLKDGFRMEGDGEYDEDKKTIMDNDRFVGRSCLSCIYSVRPPPSTIAMADDSAKPKLATPESKLVLRTKVQYTKPVCNIEKRKLAGKVGTAMGLWGTLQFDKVSRARDLTTKEGYSRVETTIYANEACIPIDIAHNFIPRTVDDATAIMDEIVSHVPKEQVLLTPHALLWKNYTAVLHHSLVVVDSRYDRALVVFSINEVTECIAAIDVPNWSTAYKFVLQRLAIGNTHTDIITVHRGRDYTKPLKEKTKRKAEEDEKRRTKQKVAMDAFLQVERAIRERQAAATREEWPEIDEISDSDSVQSETPVEEPEDTVSEPAHSTFTQTPEPPCVYNAGWKAPRDGHGCLLTSERVLRVPLKSDQLGADGSYTPTTRLVTDHPGHCFRPALPPPGWNDDGTHIDDVGERESAIGIEWCKMDRKPSKHARKLVSEELDGILRERLTLTQEELRSVRSATGPLNADDCIKIGAAFYMPTFARDLAKEQLQRAGMEPNEYVVAEIHPYVDPRARQSYAKIVACVSKLPLDARPVLKKRVLDTIPKETDAQRMDRLRQSTATGKSERDGLIDKQLAEIRLADFCARLTKSKHGTQGHALDTVAVGERYAIVGVQILGSQSDDTHIVPGMVFFLQTGESDGILSVSSTMPLNAAIANKAESIKDAHLFANPSKKDERFLLDLTGNGGSIGTFERRETTRLNKHRKKGIVLEIAIGDSFSFAGDPTMPTAAANLNTEEAVPMETDSEKLAIVTVHDGDRKSTPVLAKGTVTEGAILEVLRIGTPITYNSRPLVPLEVQDVEGTRRVVFGASNIIEIKDHLLKGWSIYIERVFVKDVKPVIIPTGEWWKLAEVTYKTLPAISRKSVLDNAYVTGAKMVHNERKKPVWVVQTEDEKIYKFEHPNHAHTLKLTENIGRALDVGNWEWRR